ncbi:MAG: microcin C ABC transporter permease, partial [Alphaproteobacteria bacterium]
MTPLAKKRWQLFKSQKRAYRSLILFIAVFVISLFAEIIANDKPIFVWYKGKAYFPIFENYTDITFGGSLPTYADYKDSFTKKQIKDNGFMIMPIVEFSYDTINYELDAPAPTPPTFTNPLGTDDQARDVFARLLYGIRISVLFGLLLTFFSSVIGIFMGAVQGYFGGKIDLFLQRFLEIWGSLPQMFVLIIVSSVLLPSFWTLLFVLLLFGWTSLVGVVRAEFLRCRNLDYVKAAKALGVSDMRIMFRHILPNALVASITYIPFILSGSIVALTALDFLGFGLPVGSASLGEMISQAKENLSAPWLGICSFLTMAILLSCLVFIGEGVRFAFDTRAKKTFEKQTNILIGHKKSNKLLCVQNLNISFDEHELIKDINFDIEKGKTVALVGESGSGKSITALSILGLLTNAKVKGSIQLEGQELIGLSDEKMQK